MEAPAPGVKPRAGAVVIGRNEAARLGACLDSLAGCGDRIVYVDSGSTDHSVAIARGRGAAVVELDPARPFSAARARNEGFERLLARHPDVELVQFVDGDCELSPGWLQAAAAFLRDSPEAGVVAGRLRERDPGASVYNALCDLEWNVPPGESLALGGIFMARAAAFREAGGFREDLLAGEEPEFARRLAAKGWKGWRVVDEMALHDAAMLRFSQWWKRAVRSGYGFAQGYRLGSAHGAPLWARELRSTLFWAVALPSASLALLALFGSPGAIVLAAFPLQLIRLALVYRGSARLRWHRASLTLVGKFAHFGGVLQYLFASRVRAGVARG